MAQIIGGIGASHSPTIAFAKDTNKANDPAWTPIFEGFQAVKNWVADQQIDVLLMIFNDHITSFFFNHYSAFVLGVDDQYTPADEGGGARDYPAVKGHVELSRHIANALVADEFDMSFFQKKPLDHGLFSPLSMIIADEASWQGSVIPLQVGVLQVPIPSAQRCYKLGKSLRKAIESYPENLRVAIVATGGLSHQVHGERCGFNNTAWDDEFLDLLEHAPEQLTQLRLADYIERGGMEGAEVIMWLIMRGALSKQIQCTHRSTYLPSMTNIATVIFEELAEPANAAEIEEYQAHINYQLAGLERLQGTYPFTLERSHSAYRLNDFLHRLVTPEHRARFISEPETLFEEFQLSTEERSLLRERNWIGLIRYGVIFFMLEKMAAVLGLSNPQIYASMRGEDLPTFLKTRNRPLQYSVAGNPQAQPLDPA